MTGKWIRGGVADCSGEMVAPTEQEAKRSCETYPFCSLHFGRLFYASFIGKLSFKKAKENQKFCHMLVLHKKCSKKCLNGKNGPEIKIKLEIEHGSRECIISVWVLQFLAGLFRQVGINEKVRGGK
ncbi:unnamed protein product [Cuscuta epithymum]|uniref:Uncharacterized protein n=1 Tax=Cuscuta epithymum TaxID=186058 RepID=A0AAV0F3C1_9ASTE|nr:unnamed protein product [Cuscuta epithymum]